MTMDDEFTPSEVEGLRYALRRKEAPPDLADRVLARINSGAAPSATPRSSMTMRWLAAAAAVLLMAGAGERYYEQQRAAAQAAEAARVQQEIRIALEITSEKLAAVQRKLQR